MHANYQRSMERVLDYIYAHLEDELDLNRLADVACLSAYHWHRVYFAAQGETVMSTVKRLRLQRAADRLANTNMPIRDIAQHSQYGSVAAFSRAFKQAYQQAPGDYRKQGSHARYKVATATADARGFTVEVVQRAAMRCAGCAHKGSYLGIDQAMGKLFAGLAAQSLLAEPATRLAVFFDDPDLLDESELASMACTPVPDNTPVAQPLQTYWIEAGTYARLAYQGPYADMRGAYRWLYGTWLPNSGYLPAEAPGFEEYLNSPVEVAPMDLLTHIHVPVVPMQVNAHD